MLVKSRKNSVYAKYNREEYDIQEIDAIEPNGIEDQIIAENDEAELEAAEAGLEEVQADLETNDAVGEEVVEQMEANEELIEAAEAGEAEVTPDDVTASNECYVAAVSMLGIDLPSITNNHESLTRDPLSALKANQEGLGDVWDKIKETAKRAWEAIKKFVMKIVDFFKKLLPTRKNKLERLKKALEGLTGNIHKDTDTEWKDYAESNFKGLAELTNKLNASDVNKAAEAVTTYVDGVEGIVDAATNLIDGSKNGINKDLYSGYISKVGGGNKLANELLPSDVLNYIKTEVSGAVKAVDGNGKDTLSTEVAYSYPAGEMVKVAGFTAVKITEGDATDKYSIVVTNEADYDGKFKAADAPSLSVGTAKTLVSDRLKSLVKTDNALSKLKGKLEKTIKKLDKAADEIAKEADKIEIEGEKAVKNAQAAALRDVTRATQKLFTGYVKAANALDKEIYKYITMYAAKTIVAVKKEAAEKAKDR